MRPSVFDRPLLTGKQVAGMLRQSAGWFYDHRADLEKRGFPKPAVYKMYDALAIQAWLDAQMSPGLKAVLEAQRSVA